MHWQMFVALCFSFNSQELSQQGLTPSSFFVLELDKAGKLPVPSLLIHDLEYLPAAAQSLRLRGYSKNHDVFFLFVFSPRGNIPQVFSEELEALHLDKEQFETIAQAEESAGRKLEFVIQEMLRETNTIGSKANDAEIARHVVEIKTCIERMREMIQNVE